MKIDLNFWMPDDPDPVGHTANKVGSQNEDMVFNFRGDDDVWVVIDGKLVLDIGGIHEALNGSINFSSGEVSVQTDYSTYRTWNLTDMGINAGAHTFTFYYMERGGNASNCEISFNLMPRWEQDPVNVSTTRVTKSWSDATSEQKKHNLQFQLKEDGTVVDTVGFSDGTVIDGTWTYVWEGLEDPLCTRQRVPLSCRCT